MVAPYFRHAGEPVLARTELAGILADGELGQWQRFEKVTGLQQESTSSGRQKRVPVTEPLWWRCCREAVRGQGDWLRGADHDAALALIQREEPRYSGIARAARSASCISQALAAGAGLGESGQPGEVLRDLVARAAGCWSGTRVASIPADAAGFQTDAALDSVSPGLPDRVQVVLACLAGAAGDPGQAMAAISALLLGADQPRTSRPVRIPVVLGERQRSGGTRGATGKLELLSLQSGPVGLFPDPRALCIMRADESFHEALRLAWQCAPGGERGRRCVLWRLRLDSGTSDFTIEGGSFGAAFAVALRELLRRPESGAAVLPAVRTFFTGPRPGYAITGALTAGQVPGRRDTSGRTRLAAVGHLDLKLEAARARGLRLIAPAANRAEDAPDGVSWAHSLREAERRARHVRTDRTAMVALSVAAVASVASVAVLGLSARPSGSAAAAAAVRAADDAALSGKLTALAVADIDTNLEVAQLLAVEAIRLDNTPQARAALFRTATASPGVQRFLQAGSEVTALAVAADGAAVAVGTSDGHLVRFDLATGSRAETADGGASIQSVAISGNGATVAAANGSGTVIWQPGRTAAAIPIQGRAFAVAVSPSGNLVAALSTVKGLAVQTAGTSPPELLTVRNLRQGTQVTTTPQTQDWDGQSLLPPTASQGVAAGYTELAFSSESVLTVTFTPGTFTDYAPARLRVIAKGSQVAAVHTGQVDGNSANGAFFGVYTAAGSSIMSGPESRGAGLFHYGNGPSGEPLSLTFSDDGKFAASVSGGTITVTPLNGDFYAHPAARPGPSTQLTADSATSSVAFVGDERLLSVSGSVLQLQNLRDSRGIGVPAGLQLAGAQTQEGPDSLTMSPDGRSLAIVDVNNATPTLTPASENSRLFIVHVGSAGAAAEQRPLYGIPVWSGDGLLQAGVGQAGALVEIRGADGALLGSWPAPANAAFSSSALGTTSDGQIIVLSGGAEISFNPRTRTSTYRTVQISGIPRPSGSELLAEAISQDGRRAVFQEYGDSDGLIYVDLDTGAARVIESGQARWVQFAGDRLFVALYTGAEQEWNAAGDRLLLTLPDGGPDTFGIAASPDGTLLAQVSNDGVASVADAASGQVIASFRLPATQGAAPDPWAITTAAFTPDDRYLFTATPGGVVTRWDIGESDLISLACYRAGSSLTPAIWDQYVQTPPPANLACSTPPPGLSS